MKNYDASDLDMVVDLAQLKSLYKTNPFIHASHILLNWVLILGTMYLSTVYFHPLIYIISVVIIGARMHALAILMHDASHFRFLKSKKWNDGITNVVSMYPLFTSIEKYRNNHLKHHRHLNTEDDPDWMAKLGRKDFTFPKSKRDFLTTVFSYFFLIKGIQDAIWFLRRFATPEATAGRSAKINQFCFLIILFIVLTVFGAWKYYLLYWVVPYFSTFFMFQYIRSVAEHFGELAYDDLLTSTRSVKANWIERFLLAPHNVGYHLEHHLYPGIPYYHLPQLHEVLMRESSYKDKAHVTIGFWSGLMNELGDQSELQERTLTPA